MPVSSLALLGSLGTILSTVALVPHLAHALRTRKPAGSAFAWGLGAACSTVWLVYGIGIGDLLVAAPGLVTIPVGVALAVWCAVDARKVAARPAMVVVPAWEPPCGTYTGGDTLEMPRIVA